jgi:hypothetical protein
MRLGNFVSRALKAFGEKFFYHHSVQVPEVFVGESTRATGALPPLRIQAYRLTPRVFALRLLETENGHEKLREFRAPCVTQEDGTSKMSFDRFEMSLDFSVTPGLGHIKSQKIFGDSTEPMSQELQFWSLD